MAGHENAKSDHAFATAPYSGLTHHGRHPLADTAHQSSPGAQDLVARLLERKPSRRLGMGPGGADDVRRHKWFDTLDWDALHARKLDPPRKPRDDSAKRLKDLVVGPGLPRFSVGWPSTRELAWPSLLCLVGQEAGRPAGVGCVHAPHTAPWDSSAVSACSHARRPLTSPGATQPSGSRPSC